jgi:uncharacterized protein
MRRTALLLLMLALAAPVAAQSPLLAQAIAAGQVGERYDGYIGIVGAAPPPAVERQVRAINIQRRNLYIELSQLSAGEAYLLQDGRWRRHAPGQSVPVPDYCR